MSPNTSFISRISWIKYETMVRDNIINKRINLEKLCPKKRTILFEKKIILKFTVNKVNVLSIL